LASSCEQKSNWKENKKKGMILKDSTRGRGSHPWEGGAPEGKTLGECAKKSVRLHRGALEDCKAGKLSRSDGQMVPPSWRRCWSDFSIFDGGVAFSSLQGALSVASKR
jgi:hypothetical protein